MKKLLDGRSIMLVLLLGLALYFVFAGLGYGRNSRIFPVAIGIVTAVLIIFDLVSLWVPRLFPRTEVGARGSRRAEAPSAEAQRVGYSGARLVRMVSWLLAGALGVGLVGFGVTVPVFILGFGRIEGRASWVACLVVAVLFFIFIVGYFEFTMRIRMFRGILFGDLLPLL
ncbi:MAG: hypothetical protein HYT78_08090 [Deltaproteobacteria bacterium]|nr:hypothetical protein [Deltaproteobacteria bacterium]